MRKRLLAIRTSGRSPGSTTRRSRPGTASRSPRWPRGGAPLERDDWRDAARGLAEFLLGPLSTTTDACGAATATARPRDRLPRRLRERRARAVRAARGDRGAAVARGGAPAGAARRRALRRRGARRLLPRTRRRRGPRRAHEGPRRQPDAVRQLDARVRAAAHGADLRRRRAGAAGRLRPASRPRSPAAGTSSPFGWALCALDLHFSPPREIAVIGSRDDAIAKAALAGYDPNAVVAFGPSEDVPLLQGKGLVEGRPAVYVCERFACQAPVTDPAALTV